MEMDDAGSILAIIVLSKIVREYQHLIYSVEKAAGIEPGAITRPGRTRCVAYARFAAVWLIHRRFPNWSLKQLSEAVGRKDHGTAIHALRMAENLIQKNDSFLNLIRRATAFQEPSHP